MFTTAIHALGGIGLFLVGMIWLTEGLQVLAGRSLRRALQRFTGTPLSGALTGAVATAIIQSSSATTVTTVGFVSAGLLSFPQALGIIFGANIGTTMTGWLAAILGFKLDLGQITLPLIFLGALARLFGGPRLRAGGTALAGFALIFLGIDALKEALAGLEGVLTPANFLQDGLMARAGLVLLGALITLVTQSSSAGVATALALVGAGVVNLPQAMALVIGMDIGTTGTAALSTLGGSIAARRTGLSHVIYNLLTGAMAFALLGPYAALAGARGLGLDPQIALVSFHTAFNLIGVVLILPFAGPFARLVIALVRERGPALTQSLGREMLANPHAATDAAASSTAAIVAAEFGALSERLDTEDPNRDDRARLAAIGTALADLRSFLEAIPRADLDAGSAARLVAMRHVIDHSGRLAFRAGQDGRIATLGQDPHLARLGRLLGTRAAQARSAADPAAMEARLFRLMRRLRHHHEIYRNRLLSGGPEGLSGEEIGQRLDAMRWLHRVAYHLWRIQRHRIKLDAARG